MLSLDKRIEVVLLMIKLESVTLVRIDLQKQKLKQISSRHIFKKFKETGSVCDTPKSGKTSCDQEKVDIIVGICVKKNYACLLELFQMKQVAPTKLFIM